MVGPRVFFLFLSALVSAEADSGLLNGKTDGTSPFLSRLRTSTTQGKTCHTLNKFIVTFFFHLGTWLVFWLTPGLQQGGSSPNRGDLLPTGGFFSQLGGSSPNRGDLLPTGGIVGKEQPRHEKAILMVGEKMVVW